MSLFAFLATAVVHAGHIPKQGLYSPDTQVTSQSTDNICPACIALHASMAQARFQAGAPELMLRRAAAMIRESAGVPPRVSRLFVRPPPAASY